MFAIACGYEDCDDLDVLRFDPAFKLACGRLPSPSAATQARGSRKTLRFATPAEIFNACAALIG